MTRAQRWGAVMLIDEADVYIRKRNDDIAANAVVGVFARCAMFRALDAHMTEAH